MGKKVDLGGTEKGAPPQKQKMIYFGIPTTIAMMMDIYTYEPAKRYVDAMKQTLLSSVSLKELRKEICTMFGMKSMRKLKKQRENQAKILTAIFGDRIWGE